VWLYAYMFVLVYVVVQYDFLPVGACPIKKEKRKKKEEEKEA
jgi:hypothetical protein